MGKLQYIYEWLSTRRCALYLVLMILILSSLGYSTNLSAFPSLKPSSIDNKYDIPIAIPIETGTTDLSINTKANLQNTTYGSEILPEELHPLESTLSTLATCEKSPVTSVTAIGNDGNIPSNAIDNNLNTRWSNLGQGSWIQLDLGSRKNICSVDIAWYRGSVGRENNFVISTSDDGTNFVERLNAKSSGTTSALQKYTMPAGTEGRYVRVTVNGNNENNWASITEISVSGSGSTTPPTTPPTGTNFPYAFVGSPQDMEDEGWDTRHYASGKPDDITHEWSGETSAQNYAIIIDITITEIDHDDQIGFKFGGTHMGSGWYDNTYSFESGKACIGKEEDHPSTDLCVITGKSIGNLVNTPVKLAAVNIGKGEKLEMYSNLGSGWTKDVESSNGVDGFRPQVNEDEVVIRIDAAPGIVMRSAQIVEIGPASTGITTSAPFPTPTPTSSDKMASTEDDGWTGGEYAGTPDEQNEKARQDWEGAGRPGDRYAGLPTP